MLDATNGDPVYGSEALYDGGGTNFLYASTGFNQLVGYSGTNYLYGGGEAGQVYNIDVYNNAQTGGGGSNTYVASATAGGDVTIHTDLGIHTTLDFSQLDANSTVTVDLANGTAITSTELHLNFTPYDGVYNFSRIDNVIGGAGTNILYADAIGGSLTGGGSGSINTLYDAGGVNYLYGNGGNDSIVDAEGTNTSVSPTSVGLNSDVTLPGDVSQPGVTADGDVVSVGYSQAGATPTVSFTIGASGSNPDPSQLHFSWDGPRPTGATLTDNQDGTATIAWIASEAADVASDAYWQDFAIRVTDWASGLHDSHTYSVATYGTSDNSPLLDAQLVLPDDPPSGVSLDLDNEAGDSLTVDYSVAGSHPTVSFIVTASDADTSDTGPGDHLTFALLDAPDGAAIQRLSDDFNDPDSRKAIVTWSPNEATDGQGSFDFVVQVTDDGLTQLSDTYDYVVNTTGTANHAPYLNYSIDPASVANQPGVSVDATYTDTVNVDYFKAGDNPTVSFQVRATDPDADATLSYDLIDAPDGASLTTSADGSYATISWSPDVDLDGTGSFDFHVVVTDNGATPLSDDYVYHVTTTDTTDQQQPTLSESASFPYGVYQPGVTSQGDVVTVEYLDNVATPTVHFIVYANVPDTAQHVTYDWIDQPDGATITKLDNQHAEIDWTPSSSTNGQTSQEFHVIVTNNDGATPLTDDYTYFGVAIRSPAPQPTPPTAPLIYPHPRLANDVPTGIYLQNGVIWADVANVHDEDVASLSFFVDASTPGDANDLTFELVNPPTGATISEPTVTDPHSATAEITWTGIANAGIATNDFTVLVTDQGTHRQSEWHFFVLTGFHRADLYWGTTDGGSIWSTALEGTTSIVYTDGSALPIGDIGNIVSHASWIGDGQGGYSVWGWNRMYVKGTDGDWAEVPASDTTNTISIQLAHGTLTVNSNYDFDYTPDGNRTLADDGSGDFAPDSFQFKVEIDGPDSNGDTIAYESNVARVDLLVKLRENTNPAVMTFARDMTVSDIPTDGTNTQLTNVGNVITKVTDDQGNAVGAGLVTIYVNGQAVPHGSYLSNIQLAHGTLTMYATGEFDYTPDGSGAVADDGSHNPASDEFTYYVSSTGVDDYGDPDTITSNSATVKLNFQQINKVSVDAAPTPSASSDGSTGTLDFTIRVTRASNSHAPITVRYKIIHDAYNADSDGNGTPSTTSGADSPTYGTVTIDADHTTATVSVNATSAIMLGIDKYTIELLTDDNLKFALVDQPHRSAEGYVIHQQVNVLALSSDVTTEQVNSTSQKFASGANPNSLVSATLAVIQGATAAGAQNVSIKTPDGGGSSGIVFQPDKTKSVIGITAVVDDLAAQVQSTETTDELTQRVGFDAETWASMSTDQRNQAYSIRSQLLAEIDSEIQAVQAAMPSGNWQSASTVFSPTQDLGMLQNTLATLLVARQDIAVKGWSDLWREPQFQSSISVGDFMSNLGYLAIHEYPKQVLLTAKGYVEGVGETVYGMGKGAYNLVFNSRQTIFGALDGLDHVLSDPSGVLAEFKKGVVEAWKDPEGQGKLLGKLAANMGLSAYSLQHLWESEATAGGNSEVLVRSDAATDDVFAFKEAPKLTDSQLADFGGCFFAGTLVATESEQKPIECLKPGDRVWACDLTAGEWKLCPIVDTYINEYIGDMIQLTVSGHRIQSTNHHPFWVVSGVDLASRPCPDHVRKATEPSSIIAGRWVDAGDLQVGDMLLLMGNRYVEIKAIEVRQVAEKVYNFQVLGLHNYAVGDDGVLVHNNSPCVKTPAVVQDGHIVDWELTGPRSGTIASGEEFSGLEFSLKPGQQLTWFEQAWYAHTEGKVIGDLLVDGKLSAGSNLSISGAFLPCSDCQRIMQWASEQFQMTIQYFDGSNNLWAWRNGQLVATP